MNTRRGKARSQVTDGSGTAPGDFSDMADLPGEPVLRLEASRSLTEIAALVLDAAVPGFAGAAAVFVLETLPGNGRAAHPAGDGGLLARRLGTRIAGLPQAPRAFPPGEVLAFAADSPYACCVRDGGPVVFSEPDSQTLDQARPGGREVMGRYASFLAVPMTAHDAVTGLIAFARTTAAAFTLPDTLIATRLAARAGAAVNAALALMRERTITGALQRGLLTTAPAVPPGLETAGRCLPADGHATGGTGTTWCRCPPGRPG
jgi:GAF domain-containing protein